MNLSNADFKSAPGINTGPQCLSFFNCRTPIEQKIGRERNFYKIRVGNVKNGLVKIDRGVHTENVTFSNMYG